MWQLILTLNTFVIGSLWAELEWIQPPAVTDKGYRVPQPDYEPNFPKDLGAHPGYAIEWWYWVGHLEAIDSDQTFGFQSTVFRLAGDPQQANTSENEHFGRSQLYMSHLALSDISQQRYIHAERIYRNGWQANAAEQGLQISAGPIAAQWDEGTQAITMQLNYPESVQLELTMTPHKPMLIFGERGLSRKGADPAAVSWYWTYSRLDVTGSLTRDDTTIALKGMAWMDHEISSSQLGGDLEGWDWTAIQLDNGTELKAYRLRQPNGDSDPWSAVYWIDAEGQHHSVYAEAFEWKTVSTWTSPHTGLRYPTEVKILATNPSTDKQETYHLRPKLADQEFTGNNSSNAYWEGTCNVFDAHGKRIGQAYLELAGYGDGLGEKLN